MDRKFLKKLILENRLIDTKRLNELESLSLNSNTTLLDTILTGKYVNESVIMPIVSKAVGLDWLEIDIEDKRLDPTLYNKLPDALKEENEILPLFKDKENVVIATSNPLKIELADKIHIATNWNISLKLIAQFRIKEIKQKFLSSESEAPDIENLEADFSFENLDDKSIEDIANEAPVIKRVNLIIMQAISIGASDIHIDPYEVEAVVRYRVDGVLKEFGRYPKNLYPALISRIKILADLNIAERRIPQDGRITMTLMNKTYDLRVATIPVLHGEGVVLAYS